MSTLNANTWRVNENKEAIEYFGSIKNLAEALNIWPHNISRGEIPPLSRQYEIEVKTKAS